MATYIISNEPKHIPNEIEYEVINGLFYFSIYTDFYEMQSLLELCKGMKEIRLIYNSSLKKILDVVDVLHIDAYVISYEHGFGGVADIEYAIPISKGRIINNRISDNSTLLKEEDAFKAVGLLV